MKIVILLFCSLIHTTAFAAESPVTRMRPMLGTYVEITVNGLDYERANQAIDAGFAAISEVDRLLSSHRTDSELNRINAAAGNGAIPVAIWTHECIKMAVDVGHQSEGAFDITCRPVLDLWGFVRKEYRLPSQHELDSALPLVNYRDIILIADPVSTSEKSSESSKPVRFQIGLARIGMKLDVGGIGKGFAVDKAVEALQKSGVRMGLVKAGGDFRGFGGKIWRVGIADPVDWHCPIVEIDILDEAISTSGDYENFFEVNGRRYGHLVDPRTGMPVQHRHSLSVRATTCTLSDAWSTALFVSHTIPHPASIRVVDVR